MWFKRLLLSYCAALLAVTMVAASITKDTTAPKSHHIVERLIFPVPERRQQAASNQTSSSEIVQSTSDAPKTSSVSIPSDTSQFSTVANAPTTVITIESTSSSTPTLTPSVTVSISASSGSSVGNGGISSTSELASTETVTPQSSATAQEPTEKSTSSLPTSTPDLTSGIASSATTVPLPSAVSSSTQPVQSSSIFEVSSSASLPFSESISTATSENNPSSEALSSLAPTSTPEATSTSTPSPQPTTTFPSPAPSSTSNQEPSPTISEPVISTSSLQEPLPTSSVEEVPVSTSSLASPSSASPTPTFSEAETSSTSEPQPPSATAPTAVETSSNVETFTAPGGVPSSPLLSAIGPTGISFSQTTTSAIETSELVSSTSVLETIATPITSVLEPQPSSSSELLPTSSFTESTPVVSDASSSSTTIDVPPSPLPVTDSSLQPTMSSSTEPSLSVPPLEPSSSASEVSITPSLSVSLSSLAVSTGPASQASPGLSTAPISIQTETFLSESSLLPSSQLSTTSTESTDFSFTSLSVGTMSSPTSLQSDIPEATFSEAISMGSSSAIETPSQSVGTSIAPSAVSSGGALSSFAPSETLLTSTTVLTSFPAMTSIDSSQVSSVVISTFSVTQPSSSGQLSSTASSLPESSSNFASASETQPIPAESSILSSSISLSSSHPTSLTAISTETTVGGTIPTSESTGTSSMVHSSGLSQLPTQTLNSFSTLLSSSALIRPSTIGELLPSSASSNGTQTETSVPIVSRTVTATFSTVYVSSVRSSVLDVSTVVFSMFSSVTGAAVNQTGVLTSNAMSTTYSKTSGTHVPASETANVSTKLSLYGNSTFLTMSHSSLTTPSGLPGRFNITASTSQLGITVSRPALPTGSTPGVEPSFNATQAEAPQTSSAPAAVNSTTADISASTTLHDISSTRTDGPSSTSATETDATSTTNGASDDDTNVSETPHAPSNTPSQTAAAGSPPPLTTSQTAGVAVGATTGLLIAVVAAIFIARRYHAAKHGKRMSTGSVYPKVAYLYDPKTGGDGGDAEALMSGSTGGIPPGDHAPKVAQGSPKHYQRHSTGTMPANRLTSLGNPFRATVRDPAVHRYSEYARIDTAQALSAAVAGYHGTQRHSSSYARYPSEVTNPFSDHVIPSPTFAPFSPDDIRRPELKTSQSANDGMGEYSQMPINPYTYLNTAASIYPPVSPYGQPPTQGPPPTYIARRQTMDSDPFADPFEHDLLLQVDERDRTSDSVTIFASSPSPNLMSPRTPRTPVGPKLPVRQPNGMTSARSLLSPVAAKYMQKAQEVKIPRKSIASPVLVQVGRSPVIKPFSPPPAAPEPLGWADIKRNSEKRFSDEHSVPGPLKFASPAIKKKPVPSSHASTKPSLTGTGQALPAGNELPLTVTIPTMYSKSVGLGVPRVHDRLDPAQEDVSSDPVVREKRSRELRFADPALIGKHF